jgi:rhamnogalacturonyl hydrolase YesR
VLTALRAAADYWMAQPQPNGNDNNWDNATFHSGNMALYRLTGDTRYRDYTLAWAKAHNFGLYPDTSSAPYYADHEAAGQVYLDLYHDNPLPQYLAALRAHIAAQVATGKNNYWTWVDALNMAMPTIVRLGVLDATPSYLESAHSMYTFTKTKAGFYDPAKSLWWRDKNYVGTDTYWSRGNGWAIAAHAKVLAATPASSPHRAEYIANLQQMAAALRTAQRSDGFWNASLTQPTVDSGQETSGTAFHTYGIAWGVNNGVLDRSTYLPVVRNAWQALATVALQSNGLVGYTQGAGQRPSDNYPWNAQSTANFGVGGFLLAGSEVINLVS